MIFDSGYSTIEVPENFYDHIVDYIDTRYGKKCTASSSNRKILECECESVNDPQFPQIKIEIGDGVEN